MKDRSGAHRARLFTAFGTVLYVDVASGRLRHGPAETSPANAVFVAEPGWGQPDRKGRLMHDKGDSLEPIACLPDHCQAISSRKGSRKLEAGTLLELVPLERGLVALSAQDLFLMADPSGAVSLSRPVCSTWELFLASEDWCAAAADNEQLLLTANAKFDRIKIRSYRVHPLIRKRANADSTATKLLIYGYPQWSHGRVYYDLCKQLHRRGYIVDIINWRENHSSYFGDILSFYDMFITALDGVRTLTDTYGVPCERVIALSHHELDIRMLIEQKGVEIFDKFANYGVVSEYVYCASLMKGVPRVPKVVPLGVNFAEFYSEISERLATVGYAGSMSAVTYGIEWKRGELAEAAAREAGLDFRVAGSTANQISFHDMPDFYRSVDAILTSSISEAAQLPVMEAAAAGRLVIGTPVGHFPRKAYEGGGILAPIEAEAFKAFTAETLRYYKDNPEAYRDKCHAIQEAAKQFDWEYTIDAWVDLIEAARRPAESKSQTSRACSRKFGASPSILMLCHPHPNYAPDLLLHGLRKLFSDSVVDYPRKDCLYEGILGQPYLGSFKDLMPKDTGIDRTDISTKVAKGFFDLVICDVRAFSEHKSWLQQSACSLAILDGEDKPTLLTPEIPYRFVTLRRETFGEGSSIPLPFSLPMEVIGVIDRYAYAPKTHNVGFLGNRSTPQRSDLLDEVARVFPDCLFECFNFDRLRGRDDYYRNLQSCRIVLNLPGAGYDTFRYWENAACNAVHVAQWMPLSIPDDFRERREIIKFREMRDLIRSIEEILSGQGDWREYAVHSRERLLAHHTTERRARYAIDQLQAAFRS